ncbi:MAG: sodium-dependent bicarbonate transport family permease [Mycobacterium sp.]|nr:sodium-dependent bicarbonate transport family permease [Mycobacterium sp.]
MLLEFWENFRHNLFKPLLLFFYLGFFIPILKVKFEFPYAIYQGVTLYLLLAIGWHGGEELASIHVSSLGNILGFIVLGFILDFFIGLLAYWLLGRMTKMRQIDRATVAGYYGSDSAGTFATCVGVLATVGMAFDGFMPVMLAVMEMPGCLVALYLAARLRHKAMDAAGNMPGEPGYDLAAKRVPDYSLAIPPGPGAAAQPQPGETLDAEYGRELEEELALEKLEHSEPSGAHPTSAKPDVRTGKLLREVLLNPGLYLLFGGIVIGLVSRLQGAQVVHDGDTVFVAAFKGVLCLFLLEMGMTASRRLKDLKTAGPGFIAFALLAPNLFATIGIIAAHSYAHLTHTSFSPGTYILFAVLCGASSYIAVPAVQRLAIPEASPTLPLAASLGLTFSYNVTIGIPLYIEISRAVAPWFT